jgi:adenylate cyclase
MKPADLLQELKDRKIASRAILYLLVAWAVIQVLDIVFPALNVPDWALSMVVVLLIVGFPVAMILAWMFDTPAAVARGRRRPSRSARAERAPTQAKDPDAPRSIAVLPFVNLSDDRENEYFSDGMTEEILNALTRIPELRVASRTSSFAFKGMAKDVQDIADALRVDTVVEGSVRKAGDRVRVSAQLVDAEDGYHLWSETYDGGLEDIFRLQDSIARSIVEALKIELVGADSALVDPETDDVEAYTHYLKGRFFFYRFQQDDLKRSLEQYEEALIHDPDYGRAYAGIADTWMQLADDWVPPERSYPEAKAAAQKAIELDESLAEAHTALGKVYGWFEWDFDRAELALRRAVSANPRYPDAHWGLGSILPPNGQLGAAIEEMRTALSLDPLSPVFSYFLARFLMFAGQLQEAVEESKRTAELDPTSFRALQVLGQCHLQAGEPDQALERFQRAHEVSGVVSVNAYIAGALAALGREGEARALLARVQSGDAYVRSEFMAAAWGALGELDKAFEALETAFQARSAGLIYCHVDPAYEVLWGDPRFDDLATRIGLKREP